MALVDNNYLGTFCIAGPTSSVCLVVVNVLVVCYNNQPY